MRTRSLPSVYLAPPGALLASPFSVRPSACRASGVRWLGAAVAARAVAALATVVALRVHLVDRAARARADRHAHGPHAAAMAQASASAPPAQSARRSPAGQPVPRIERMGMVTITPGKGAAAKAGDRVSVHYVGHAHGREEVRQLSRPKPALSVRPGPGPGHQGLGRGRRRHEGGREAQAHHPAGAGLRAAGAAARSSRRTRRSSSRSSCSASTRNRPSIRPGPRDVAGQSAC